ncbi:GntR family transcriptional regulator [Pseudochrobactrum asaccharolyticum]|uniref:GntR family transcriptional regulator n=2 Tax=Brucellaceae TaxID=118882 RepID=A0A366E051_9HYPH|nr:GntR family transcriptional regulator [Pseudochrobactrum asaccharolyticum]MBX8800091.1 GntR family transcriptional regulator [Ochrobactrum sp. MR28]MBX8817385.1 GntR family transcriptional regulator [Ochrobactrum sp. MR31]RBO95677.1 GntR family transcriptional regulator [Pseudochrobactrum asaccharolyticum]
MNNVVASDKVDLRSYLPDDDSIGMNRRAYLTLREALLIGAYRPGTHLNIKPIAEELGMSSMPVREAMGRLSSESVLEIMPNRGFKVPVLKIETFRELLMLRIRLEEMAGAHAAVLATQEDIETISALYEEMLTAQKRSMDEALRIHRQFHFAIYRVANMPIMMEFIEQLWLRLGPHIYASLKKTWATDVKRHHEIVAALRARDSVGAAQAIRDDIASGADPAFY